MEQLIKTDAELFRTGFFPDLENLAVPFWVDLKNVWFADRGIQPLLGATALHTFEEELTGMAQAYVSGTRRAYVGGQTKAWYYTDGGGATQICSGLTSTARTRIETYGNWAIINNGVDKPLLWKNTGVAAVMGTLPYSWAKHMLKFKSMLLALNTSTDPNLLAWSSMDNPEDWEFTNPENTAGNLFVRDLDGPIIGACPMGDAIAAYSNETLIRINFLGNAFVIGATPTLTGVGLWGGESVVQHEDHNFGFGPQGIFRTDGAGFTFLDQDRVKDYIKESIDLTRREEAFCYRNEQMSMIEFVYVDQDGARRRLGLDLNSGGFWPFDKELHRAIERQVFDVPLGTKGTKLLALNTGSAWDGEAIAGQAETKPLSADDPTRAMTINLVQVEGDRGAVNLKFDMYEEPSAVNYTAYNTAAVFKNWFNAEGLYVSFKLSFASAVQKFEINALRIYGILTGRVG